MKYDRKQKESQLSNCNRGVKGVIALVDIIYILYYIVDVYHIFYYYLIETMTIIPSKTFNLCN